MVPLPRRLFSTGIVLLGHAVAVAAFVVAPTPPGVSASWRVGFPIILTFTTLLLTGSVWVSRVGVRPILFTLAAGFHTMASLGLGESQAPLYALAATFVYTAMVTQRRHFGMAVSAAYALLITLTRGPVMAWEADLGAPSAFLHGLFLLFLVLEVLVLDRIRQLDTLSRSLEQRVAGLTKNIDALTSANIDFQEYATRVQREAEHKERNRIAREIHDIVGYTLMNIQMMMEAAQDMHAAGSEELPVLLGKVKDQSQRGLFETRKAMRELRALAEPESAGMRGLLELTKIYENATHVRVVFNPGNFPEHFDAPLEDLLRRFLQESLTNAFRHGNAETVVVNFWKNEDSLNVAIHDDGAGSAHAVPGIGLAGMRERLAAMGGRLIVRDGGKGFSLIAVIPRQSTEVPHEP